MKFISLAFITASFAQNKMWNQESIVTISHTDSFTGNLSMAINVAIQELKFPIYYTASVSIVPPVITEALTAQLAITIPLSNNSLQLQFS